MKKKMLAALVSATILCGSVQVSASSNFFADVPTDDWSYGAVNELIDTGKIEGYTEKIPDGRIMSRIEMAMIIVEAQENISAFSKKDQKIINQLAKEYFYDIKKLQLLEKLNSIDEAAFKEQTKDFSQEEVTSIKKFIDKFSVDGYVRLRNDHYKTEDGRTTRANMIHLQVNTTYKINDDWKAHLDMGYRNSFSGFDKTNNMYFSDSGENDTGLKMDTYLVGDLFDKALNVKAGKWNEWNPYGWGMDIDCDFSGVQLTYGKKDFKTFATVGKMDLWDNFMGGSRDSENVSSLRFFYPFDKKSDVNFGVSYSSGMASRYQDPNDRVFYYYVHGHHQFNSDWDVRAGTIYSDAKRNPNDAVAGTKTKHPGRWLQVQYKNPDLQKPGTYAVVADYRYEPALVWPTVTDWCGLNEKFIRLGAYYVPGKNILLNTFYTWAREIDTNDKNDLYRFQAEFFF